ncbi:unnamed protein product [Schistosoma mattheei]|uniref:Uncharacterized protein n=2 Tax=Schistosoma TaxID=6181 RepID=A0A183NGJ2_9TREM|nr:unnamed protein product [Schistosoma mattheei]
MVFVYVKTIVIYYVVLCYCLETIKNDIMVILLSINNLVIITIIIIIIIVKINSLQTELFILSSSLIFIISFVNTNNTSLIKHNNCLLCFFVLMYSGILFSAKKN